MEDTNTSLFVWGFDPEVEEPEIFNLLYNNGRTSLVSVSIERDDMQNSLGRARAVFRNPQHAQDSMVLSNVLLNRSPIYMSLYSFPECAIPAGVTGMTQGSTSQVNSFQEWTIPAAATEMTQGSTSQVNSLGRARAVIRNPQHAQDSMLLPHFPLNRSPIYIPLYSFPEWAIPAGVTEMTQGSTSQWIIPAGVTEMTQGSTSQVNSLGQGRAMFRNPQRDVMVLPHFPRSSVFQRTIPAEMTQGSTSQLVGQSRMGDVHVANQRYEEIREGMERKLNLYVANFSYDLNETDLRNIFSRFGEVSSCAIRRDKVSGRSRGDGFVNFLTEEDAERARSLLNGQLVNGREIRVSFAEGKSKV